jgi:hypothetical protein
MNFSPDPLNRAAAALFGGLLLGAFGPAGLGNADSICGAGKHLSHTEWACLPGDGASGGRVRTNNGANSRIAAGVAIGGLVLSLVDSLARGTRMTDNANTIPTGRQSRTYKPLTVEDIKRSHGTKSREFNRKGIALQLAGDYDGARRAFTKAAEEASEAGNHEDENANRINASIADALHYLHAGYQAERAGKITRANISYKLGMDAARNAEREDLAAKLRDANSHLIRDKSDTGELIRNEEDCEMVNGEYACGLN